MLSQIALGSMCACAADSLAKAVRLGIVGPETAATMPPRTLSAFRQRLAQLGWVEGQNLTVEWRWAGGHYDRLPALVSDVLERKVDVLVTWTTPAVIAAKNATRTVPIVAGGMGDPVRSGLVASLAQPGGNLTGMSLGFSEGVASKWLELLQEAVPQLSTFAVISNPGNPANRDYTRELETTAASRGLKLRVIEVREADAFDRAFAQAGRQAQAVVVIPDPLTVINRGRIAALAARHRLPAMYGLHPFLEAGGMMAYAPDMTVMYRRMADYVDKILRGAKPAELPIEQPTQYLLAVNLKAAKALGITIPESILLRADEVIR